MRVTNCPVLNPRTILKRLLFVLFLCLGRTLRAEGVPATAAQDHVGENTTVCGKVTGVHQATASRGKPTFEGGGVLPCLILPGRKKEFFYDTSLGEEYREFWDDLWSQAKQALKTCDKVVICEYSLPLADQRARDLLLNGARKEGQIEIVCGGQSDRIAEDFRTAGFDSVIVSPEGHFENWVERQAERVEVHSIAARL